jgi:Zn-finger domain-containing protein
MMITPLQRLKQALEAHRQALAKLEAALTEFEGTLAGEASEQPDGLASELLSMEEVRQTLGRGKSWTQQQPRLGQVLRIPSG